MPFVILLMIDFSTIRSGELCLCFAELSFNSQMVWMLPKSRGAQKRDLDAII